MKGFYSREALRQARERRDSQPEPTEGAPSTSDTVPLDAPYDEPEAPLHAWTGEKWVPWKKWLPHAIVRLEPEGGGDPIRDDAECIAATCGGVRIWLVRDSERWLMFTGSRAARSRRRDFASPSVRHAMATAEQWYGAPEAGWSTEKTSSNLQTDQRPRVADSADAADAEGNDLAELDWE